MSVLTLNETPWAQTIRILINVLGESDQLRVVSGDNLEFKKADASTISTSIEIAKELVLSSGI